MEFSNALPSKSSSCADISTADDPSSSAEYITITDSDQDDEETFTNYESASIDLVSIDLSNEEPSLSNAESSNVLSPKQQQQQPRGKLEEECKICFRQYLTLQECLRHELLEHDNSHKSPQKNIRTSLSNLLPALKQTNTQADRKRIHELFQNCGSGLELHELFQIYCINDEKVREFITAVNTCLLKDLSSCKNLQIYTFGSSENGLMMWDSDIDIYITMNYPIQSFQMRSNDNKERRIYNSINSQLRRGKYFDEIVAIRRARVPIIKCRNLVTGMKIDINCSCPNSVVNTKFLRELMRFDVRLHSFVRFMKIWAKNMLIVGRHRMTSYCFCILLLFYLQQPRDCGPPFVPSIRQLQSRAPPNYVQGVNYAFDLYQHMRPLSAILTVSDLLRGFFTFYRNFDFKQIIAPYLGVTISLEDFRTGNYIYTAYLKQMNSMKAAARSNEEIEPLSTDRVIVVQDPFHLNQNISRSLLITDLEYFRKCIEYGYQICTDANIRTDGQLYEALLFDIIDNIENEARQLQTCSGQNTSIVQPHEMIYTFSPSRDEIRALTANQSNSTHAHKSIVTTKNSIYHLWTRHYIEVIYIILTHVYSMDTKLLTEIDNPYDDQFMQRNTNDLTDPSYYRQLIVSSLKQLDEKNEVTWVINGAVDTWTNRTFLGGNSQTFMSVQCAQTKKFLNERHNKQKYAVKLLGRLTIKPIEGKTLELVLKQHQQTRQWFCKMDPMRKFFSNFKCSLQNFNIKEKLHAESGRKFDMPSKSGETFLWQGIASETLIQELQE